MFKQEGKISASVQLQGASQPGAAAGILFGATDNPGQVGGQRAKNLLVASYGSLAGLPSQ